jgi:hypothetical protein
MNSICFIAENILLAGTLIWVTTHYARDMQKLAQNFRDLRDEFAQLQSELLEENRKR